MSTITSKEIRGYTPLRNKVTEAPRVTFPTGTSSVEFRRLSDPGAKWTVIATAISTSGGRRLVTGLRKSVDSLMNTGKSAGHGKEALLAMFSANDAVIRIVDKDKLVTFAWVDSRGFRELPVLTIDGRPRDWLAVWEKSRDAAMMLGATEGVFSTTERLRVACMAAFRGDAEVTRACVEAFTAGEKSDRSALEEGVSALRTHAESSDESEKLRRVISACDAVLSGESLAVALSDFTTLKNAAAANIVRREWPVATLVKALLDKADAPTE